MTAALDNIRPVAVPARIGQATAVEQSRAIAQVQAMVIVAQQCPRNVPGAIRGMEEACRQYELAQQAFFRFPRAGQTVSGPSVHLARELARCWGNIEHGVTEMRRDDAASESEMQAFAWDLETNTRSASVFIVPHKRDTRDGVRDLTDMRDIYENNANNGARRLREAIFSVLPVWFRVQAMALCEKTLEDGGGKPLAVRIADAVTAFERYRVTPARIAAKFGHTDVAGLTAHDVGQLGVIYESLRQGTVTVDEEFPAEQARVTAADITGDKPDSGQQKRRRGGAPKDASPADAATPRAAAPQSQPPAEPAGEVPARASTGQRRKITSEYKRLGYNTADPGDARAMLRQTAKLALLDELGTLDELNEDQAARVLQYLAECGDITQLQELLDSGEAPGEGDG